MEYTPDHFIIMEIIDSSGTKFHRLLGGWSGSYTNGTSWRGNSGITKIETHGDYYHVYGNTGSIYKVNKNSERLHHSMMVPYDFIMKHGNNNRVVKIDDILPLYICV